ncbi:MAG: hypothetical protein WBA74_06090 [Cyclobacteriaceae bacterium]
MKKLFLNLAAILGIVTISFGQSRFEPGYYIDNSGEKHEVLIKELKGQKNPEKLYYSATADDQVVEKSIEEVKEFGFNNGVKFRRFVLEVDQSVEDLNTVMVTKDPIYKTDTLLLKELVASEASLYGYSDGTNRKYFYQKKDETIKELINKYYNAFNGVGVNDMFRSQLARDVNCNQANREIQKLNYYRNSLIKYFIDYNTCMGYEYKSILDKTKSENSTGGLSLTLKGGVSKAKLDLDYLRGSTFDTEFEERYNMRLGAEMEIIFPGTYRKLAAIIEPFYTRYNDYAFVENSPSSFIDEAEVIFEMLGVSVGVRYYIPISASSRFFVNANIESGKVFDSRIEQEAGLEPLDIASPFNGSISFGYSFKNRLFVEYRLQVDNNLLPYYPDYIAKYQSSSLSLGFRVLN